MKSIFSLILFYLFCSTSLNSQVSIAWVARYDGGFGDDAGLAIITDESGNVYVTGNSHGNQTRRDLVVIKYSPAGANLWTRRIADTANNNFRSGSDIEIDDLNNVIVGGTGLYKYDLYGNLLWSNVDVGCRKMSLDNSNSIYTISGTFYYRTKKQSCKISLII